ncbi:hypothetical protein E2C01_002153 [Portunus trituberculatus]|uniref:Uncharacterized protein n=1 Tax=Portunus trituberculatus TaxID=210409 RepID=A0A5B7CJM4_PORTR|nr:hypothetical protein [Portunus trituberculatus]
MRMVMAHTRYRSARDLTRPRQTMRGHSRRNAVYSGSQPYVGGVEGNSIVDQRRGKPAVEDNESSSPKLPHRHHSQPT